MLNPDTIRSALGVIGFTGESAELLMPTIWRMLKNKDVEEFKFHPYVAGIMNCVMWVFYSMPFVHPHSVLVTTINSVGFIMYVAYLTIYWAYSNNKKRVNILDLFYLLIKSIALYLLGELAAFAALACVTLLVFHTHTRRSTFVGIFCDVFGIILYGSPLTVMWKVIKTKSVEFMPLSLSVTGLANGIIWSAYAFIRFDPYILIGNGIGALLGLSQLILYGCYYSTTPKKSKQNQMDAPKPSQVQLSTASLSGPAAV
ncbi:hypothetical protein Cgig2_022169 [Carnegiea gigantea]|uniref:Bidirectional sugar transporter SWEET n=1 Tax=Carnegiea gigantea TaxID=171969 RepID=A0A9Q1Q9I3_9CARY|nr:hypothetical protein Cgig2_022169 [Carnegiea gigantea]